jgi:hypothetical protein
LHPQESKTAEDQLFFVEGMQFERGYISPYFVTDPERMACEYDNCRLLLVDKKVRLSFLVFLSTVQNVKTCRSLEVYIPPESELDVICFLFLQSTTRMSTVVAISTFTHYLSSFLTLFSIIL